jgi:hypothetical protein
MHHSKKYLPASAVLGLLTLGSSCTKDLPGQFLLQEDNETLGASQLVNTKVDMLWVIDNSPSMENVQSKVRAGISQFAQTYMQPTWDIRVATISTDTYLADPSFSQGPSGQASYLTSIRSGTANYATPYLNGASKNYGGGVVIAARSQHYYDTASLVTATTFPLFNLFDDPTAYTPPSITYNSSGTERFLAAGLSIADTKPLYGTNWAKLLVGNHDGPGLSMCWDDDAEGSQFITGVTACYHRDDPANPQYHVGIANCVDPNTANGETGPSQCVNTLANNTVHTGLRYISTIPPEGTPGNQAWTNSLIGNFQVNLTPSTQGDSSERPFQSVQQFLKDNETDPSLAFFRPGSLRVIVFVGDEDDQSQTIDPNQYEYGNANGYGGGTSGNYTLGKGTDVHMVPENASAPFICKKSYTGANSGYFFPTDDPGYCVDPAWLTPVSTVKADLDNFFLALDGAATGANPNYFVATITTMNTAGLSQEGYTYIAQRYPALANLVGNGSLVLDITQSDYTPLLNQVGTVILQQKAIFDLKYPATAGQLIVQIVHSDGSTTVLTPAQYTVAGNVLTITDLNVVSGFSSGDQLNVQYEPSSSQATS